MHVVMEEPLAVYVNGVQRAVLMRMPGLEKELAAGFCLSEGLVGSFAGVRTIQHCGNASPMRTGFESEDGAMPPESESRNRVDIDVCPDVLYSDARLEVVRLIRAGCGGVDVARAAFSLPHIESDLSVPTTVLLRLNEELRMAQNVHRHVGGVHVAALYTAAGDLVVACEDVGRHNAVDKALGHCLLRDIPLSDKLILCSGRLSHEMVAKAIRMRVPVLASMSAPTALALQLAETFGLTVIGYLRGNRMTVYTHARRVLGVS